MYFAELFYTVSSEGEFIMSEILHTEQNNQEGQAEQVTHDSKLSPTEQTNPAEVKKSAAKLNKSRHTELMTEGSIFKNLLFFSIPLILGNLLQQTYNAVDSIIVGNYVGSNALAAVGAGTSLINLLIAFGQGAAVGAGVIIAQYLGARDSRNIKKAVHTSVAIALVLGIVLTVLGLIFTRKLLILMSTPAEVLDDAARYLQVFSLGLVFNVLYNMAAGILNSAGNSRRSLIYLAAAAVTNIVMDFVLIVGFKMGVVGAAVATDLSQAISCILAFAFLIRVPADYKVVLKEIRIHKHMMMRVIRIGLPTGIQNMVISLSNILLQSSVNGFGAAAMAGFCAYLKIDGFTVLPALSFSMAITTFVGQNYGAGRYDRLKKGIVVTVAMCTVYTIISGIALLINDRAVMHLFSSDESVIEYGIAAMKYFCPFYWVLGLMHGLGGAVRGTGHSMPPMIIMLISMCLLRIVWIILILPYFETIDGIFVLYPVTWAIGAVLMMMYFFAARWLGGRRILSKVEAA